MNVACRPPTPVRVFVLCLLVGSGCDSGPRGGGAGAPPTATVEASGNPEEVFVFIAEGHDRARRAELMSVVDGLVGGGTEGSVVHVVRTPDHTPIATFRLAGPAGRGRRRDPAIVRAAATLGKFLKDDGDVPEDFRIQVRLSMVLESVDSLRETDLRSRLVLVGSPLHHAPPGSDEAAWNFDGGRYPSPSSLTDPTSTLPFLPNGRRLLDAETPVVWLTPAGWSFKAHEEAVVEFHRALFESLGGRLVRVTSDAAAAFDPEAADGFAPMNQADDPLPPRLLTAPREGVPAFEATSIRTLVVPDHVRAEIETAEGDPRRILIAVNWASRFAETDLDLWVRSRGGDREISFETMTSNFGRLVRDVLRPGSASDRDFESWELCIIDHDRVDDLTVWLNAYRAHASGPSDVVLVTVVKGRKSERRFVFDVPEGDRAAGAGARNASPAWMRIDLAASN